jgi:hypothetical protein
MARGSGFGALGKNFIIVGNAQHRIFGLRFGYLIRATTSFLMTYREATSEHGADQIRWPMSRDIDDVQDLSHN